ncbi:hypothetical protein BGZ65_004247 [Modicella reniformis]|uniref:Uncharacterized protein n=1 Tax=Modicella reniformis TaxID=1440133 RepID=A0A9P6SV66_9FUNG|nr:hypothetical protein BGZ65_004247 [Modicella reniformis]
MAVPPVLEDPGLKEMSGDTVSELLEHGLNVNGNRSTILLLDMRSLASHTTASIKTAVNVNIPIMLLKRPMFSLDMVTEQLTTPQEVQIFSNWKWFPNIVMFDAIGSTPIKGTPMFCIAQKFRRERCAARLSYIRGGYNAFMQEYASLCCRPDSSTEDMATHPSAATTLKIQPIPASTSPPRCRLHLGSLPKTTMRAIGATADCQPQTPMIENPDVNPLFESVRQAMGLNTNITEEVPVRLPPNVSIESIRDKLPTWLLEAIHNRTGKTRLAEYFQKIETSEKNRLALLMAPQEIHSGKQVGFSICAGIEKAPLPSTFEDFWKVIWEQDSRVIVMLTREVEIGRIKCHRYWPTTEQPVMEFGSLRVKFLTSDWSGTVLVRQLQLSHVRHDEEVGRTITQIQYTGWPDFGVPETPLEVLKVVELAHERNLPVSAGPMVVHCSAGCGRTGAFCVIDSILTEIKNHPASIFGGEQSNTLKNGVGKIHPPHSNQKEENSLPQDTVFTAVNRFREQRLSMVQCLRQYVFCYEVILWYMLRREAVKS